MTTVAAPASATTEVLVTAACRRLSAAMATVLIEAGRLRALLDQAPGEPEPETLVTLRGRLVEVLAALDAT